MTEMLEDLDFADGIVLLSYRHRDIQEKTNGMTTIGKQIGININASKTKILKRKSMCNIVSALDYIAPHYILEFYRHFID